jgi:hypothetical protein
VCRATREDDAVLWPFLIERIVDGHGFEQGCDLGKQEPQPALR